MHICIRDKIGPHFCRYILNEHTHQNGQPSMSARRSAIPFRNIGDTRVRRIGSDAGQVWLKNSLTVSDSAPQPLDPCRRMSSPSDRRYGGWCCKLSSQMSRFVADREDSSPMAGLIDHSVEPVGESFLLMGASDRGGGGWLMMLLPGFREPGTHSGSDLHSNRDCSR